MGAMSKPHTVSCQYSDGKRWTSRFEKWDLICEYPSVFGNPDETYCHVERTRFLRLEDLDYETGIAQLLHSSVGGTLKLTNADWEKGKLDFQLVHDDGSTIEVMLRLRYENNSIHLKEFKAIGIVKGTLSDTMEVIEYRIPEYTYTLDMRVTMRGLKSESDKRQEELLQSLSPKDRAFGNAWVLNVTKHSCRN